MRIAPAFLQTFAVQFMQTVASLLTGILIARGLGPSGQGQYAFVAAAVAFGVTVASFGQFEGNVLSSAGALGPGRVLLARAILHSVAVGLLLVALSPLWSSFFVEHGIARVSVLLSLIMVLEVQALLLRGINLGQHHITAYNAASLIQRLTLLIVVLGIGMRLGWTVSGVLYAWAIATLSSVILSAAWIWFRSDPVAVSRITLLHDWGRSLKRGARALVTIAFTILLVRCDIWMLGWMMGSATAGQMSVASTLGEWFWYVPSILANVLFAAAAANSTAAAGQISRAARAIVILVVPAMLVLMLVGRQLVPLVYGRVYAPAGLLFMILVPGMAAIALHLVVDSFFAGRGFPAISIWAAIGAFLTKVGLNLVVIPVWGGLGAAAVTTMVYSGLAAVKVAAFSRETGTPLSAILRPTWQDVRGNAMQVRAWLAARLGQPGVI